MSTDEMSGKNDEQDIWRTPAFRNYVRAKIEGQLRPFPIAIEQEVHTIENSAFNTSSSQEEYVLNIRKHLKVIRRENRQVPKLPSEQEQNQQNQLQAGMPDQKIEQIDFVSDFLRIVRQKQVQQQQNQQNQPQACMPDQNMGQLQTDPMSALQIPPQGCPPEFP